MIRWLPITALALALGGCAATVPVVGPRVNVGAAGSTSAAALTAPQITEMLRPGGLSSLPEYARLDDSLNIRAPEPLLATVQWPQARRPSLYRPLRIFIQDRDGTFVFFPSPRHRQSGRDYRRRY